MKILKKIGWLLLLALIIAQFFRPDKNEGDIATVNTFMIETQPTENVKYILKETCFDCHSNFTRYPWYSQITPINYWLADHIRHGKGELNFSAWDTYSSDKKKHKLEEIVEYVGERWMPLNSYTWGHPEAKLTDEQIEEVVAWAKQAHSSNFDAKD